MGTEKRHDAGAGVKALFITPPSHEPRLIVSAWNSWNEKAAHTTFDIWGPRDDPAMLRAAREARPDVIFYVGGNAGPGLPTYDCLRKLRAVASLVHLCWDATDEPWHRALKEYKDNECFDLQVAMDGGTASPVDMATLTPVDPRPYEQVVINRGRRCAFSGQNVARAAISLEQHPRWHVLSGLVGKGWVEFRARTEGPYAEYAAYLKGCRILLNISHTGSGHAHHVKVRIVEAGLAGCALLEMHEAPTRDWIPEGYFFVYRNVEEAISIIRSVGVAEIAGKAAALSEHVRENYNPQAIYQSILDRL